MGAVPRLDIGEPDDIGVSVDEWRDSVSLFFDIEPLSDRFAARISSFSLGELLIGSACASAQKFRRDAAVIKRSQIDHIMVQLYVKGSFVGTAESEPVSVMEGDICCFDLGFGFATQATDFENITMIIPKPALRPMAEGTHLHGLVLKAGEPASMLLAAHMRELLNVCDDIADDEAEAIAKTTIELLRLCLDLPKRKRLAPGEAANSIVTRMREFIGQNLANPELSDQRICEEFGISRATLYRHFEPYGGVASVIRNWRLSNVFADLESNGSEPIHAIARRNGFSNEASCARAFKARYGMTPSALRKLKRAPQDPSERQSGRLADWVADLGRR